MIEKSILISVLLISITLILISVTPKIQVYEAPAIKLHRESKIITQQANVWEDVVFEVKVDSESNYGIDYNESIIEITVDGLYYISGCIRPIFEGGGNPTVDVGVRILKSDDNGETWRELRCLQSFSRQERGETSQSTQHYSGTCNVRGGSMLRVQTYVSNVNMNFLGWDGFDNPVSASVQMFRFSD